MAGTGGQGLLCISRGADELSVPGGFPGPHRSALEACADAPQPASEAQLEADAEAHQYLVATTAHSASLARAALRRYAPEVGAVCPNRARTALCGGRAVMRVATAKAAPLIQRPAEHRNP